MTQKTRAQAMVEYLMVIGIALFILIPTIMFFTSQTQSVTADAAFAKMDSIGISLIELVDSMYILGEDSKTTLAINLPAGLQNITVINYTSGSFEYANDLVFDVQIGPTQSQLLYVSTYPFFIGRNCTGGSEPLPSNFIQFAGKKSFKITSCGDSVAVWYQE